MLAGMWRRGAPCTLLVEYKLVKPYEKKHRGSSEIKNRSSNLTPGIYPKEMKSVC
jgi:hypothetical protein